MLAEGSKLGDKCSVKRSVIGRHCRIGSNVKVDLSFIIRKILFINAYLQPKVYMQCQGTSTVFHNNRFFFVVVDCQFGCDESCHY